MPVLHVILLALALLATFVMAVSWSQDLAAPTPWEWFVSKVTEGGFWSSIFLSLLAVAFFGWRASRNSAKAREPN